MAKKYLPLLALSLMTTSAFAQKTPEPTEVSGLISWVFDYETGKELSKLQDKPMFVVFRCER